MAVEINLLLVVGALALWGVLLALALADGWGARVIVTIAATVVTCVLVAALIAALRDGSAPLRQRPLGDWAVFALLTLAASPFMLAAPLLQLAWAARGRSSRMPALMLAGAMTLALLGSGLYLALREKLERHALAQARAVAQGQVMQHVAAARHSAAVSWLSPYLWTEGDELKWATIGLATRPFIDSLVPLFEEDLRAVAILVNASAGTPGERYTGKLAGKLGWDRLMRASAGDRAAMAAGLTRREATRFTGNFGIPHADGLCAHLADGDTRNAIERLWALLADQDKREFSARIREKCGLEIGAQAS